jgi:hypothetical protein
VGFLVRLGGGRLRAELAEVLPDFQFAFEGAAEVRAVWGSASGI